MSEPLHDAFFLQPDQASTTMTAPELRTVLMRHNGQIIAKGILWDIRSEHIGVGVYRVYLAEAKR